MILVKTGINSFVGCRKGPTKGQKAQNVLA